MKILVGGRTTLFWCPCESNRSRFSHTILFFHPCGAILKKKNPKAFLLARCLLRGFVRGPNENFISLIIHKKIYTHHPLWEIHLKKKNRIYLKNFWNKKSIYSRGIQFYDSIWRTDGCAKLNIWEIKSKTQLFLWVSLAIRRWKVVLVLVVNKI